MRIASEQAVCAGDVLVSGALDLHVRLEVLGERAVMDRLVDEVLGLLGPCEVERDSLHAILAQLVGFAMLVERGDTALEVGAIVTMDAFAAENERVMGSGGRPATAAQVFLGLSEALTH